MNDAAWQVKFSAYKTAAETQITALRAEVERLQNEVYVHLGIKRVMQADVNALATRLSARDAEVKSLNDKVTGFRYLADQHKQDADKLRAEIEALKREGARDYQVRRLRFTLHERDAEVRALRGFARDVAIRHGKDNDVASRLRAYGLMDFAGNATPLLTGEQGTGGSDGT